jgi:Protein of unknown function (DUF1569)
MASPPAAQEARMMSPMPLLHDRQVRAEIETRVKSLRSDSRGRWGLMSVDQMLWHVNEAIDLSLGRITVPAMRFPVPRSWAKAVVLHLPWMKSAPTHPAFVARNTYDFAEQQARCLQLIDDLTAVSLDGSWPPHPGFGAMTGREISKLMAKHLDHHLRQFGA